MCMNSDDEHILCILSTGGILQQLYYYCELLYKTSKYSVASMSINFLEFQIEQLQDADMFTVAFQELGKSFPTVMETLVIERDM